MLLFLSSCQLGYYWHVSTSHLALLYSEQPIEDVLKSGKLTEEQKRKIELVQQVREFAFTELQLNRSKNYTEYVDLGRPYVTYAVSASQKWKFEPYLWDFLFIGEAPYKGFYSEKLAREEAEELKKKDLDVSIRGVPAFSTLGKLSDPLLSSMLNYSDYHLANTIIHELTHTTLFIKSSIDFNERLAVFVANKGTEMFYKKLEGENSPTLKRIQQENEDDAEFSKFITTEIEQLKQWYKDSSNLLQLPADEREKLREDRLNLIGVHFEKQLKPKMKTHIYDHTFDKTLNNADLSVYNTYMKSLDVFEKVYQKNGANIPQFLKKCQELKNVDDPEKELEKWASSN